MLARTRQRGDTLIEVLFAITVFSLIVVATLALMNQGTSAARRSVEMTLVREQIDAQAESLRFLHEAYVAAYQPGISYDLSGDTSPAEEYAKIIDRIITANRQDATAFGDLTSCPASAPTDGFLVNPRTARVVTNPVNILSATDGYPQLQFDETSNAIMTGQGLWIEGVRTAVETDGTSLTRTAGYIDFYIRACWSAPGLDKALTMGTIVRLYEPRG